MQAMTELWMVAVKMTLDANLVLEIFGGLTFSSRLGPLLWGHYDMGTWEWNFLSNFLKILSITLFWLFSQKFQRRRR